MKKMTVNQRIMMTAFIIFHIGLWGGFYVGINSEMAKMKCKIMRENDKN